MFVVFLIYGITLSPKQKFHSHRWNQCIPRKLQEVNWGEIGFKPDLAESMNDLTREEHLERKLNNQLTHLLRNVICFCYGIWSETLMDIDGGRWRCWRNDCKQ